MVLDARSSYRPVDFLELFVKIENLLDTEYDTFGLLGDPSAVLATADPRFAGPGAPFGLWAGLTLETP